LTEIVIFKIALVPTCQVKSKIFYSNKTTV